MRSPLALFLLSTSLAATARADGNSCSPESVSQSAITARCSTADSRTPCKEYLDSVLVQCNADLNARTDEVIAFKKKPHPLSEADEKAMNEARSEILSVMELQTAFSNNVTHLGRPSNSGNPDEPVPKPLPGIDMSAFDAEAILTNLANDGSINKMNSTQEGTVVNTAPGTGVKAKPDTQVNEVEETMLRTSAVNLENLPVTDPGKKREVLAAAGNTYLRAGDTKDAERVATTLLKAKPDDSNAQELLAATRLAQGRPKEAEDAARRALELDPGNRSARETYGYAHALLSKDGLKRPGAKPDFGSPGDAGGAAGAGGGAQLGRAGATPPPPGVSVSGLPPQPALVVPAYLQHAMSKARLDRDGAILDLTLALDQNPEDDLARILRAELNLDAGNAAPALADAERILAKHPDDPRALRAKAGALLQLGRVEEALAVIERAVALDPLSAAGHLIRAQVLEKLARLADAAAEYKEAGRLDPALTPVVDAALKRLGFGAKPSGLALPRGLLRGGLVTASLVLVLVGLLGGAAAKTLRSRPASQYAARDSERTLAPGEVIGRQYRITRELGRGGMGVVFEAVDETLKRPVALKQLQSDMRVSDEDAARFLQEARLVAQLRHPHIAAIHSAVDDGGLFLVFELIEGVTLDKVLAQKGPMDPAEVRRLVGEMTSALSCAHERRIVHRDLKPSNVMIDGTGLSKIMDFGIAHQGRGSGETKTSASGTPPYMAPEQAMGTVLPASDLYALGVMTYELLCGRRPFLGPDFLGPKLRGEFTPVTRQRPALPAALDGFFSAVLSPDPDRRPRDAAAFRRAFDGCWDASLPKTTVG